MGEYVVEHEEDMSDLIKEDEKSKNSRDKWTLKRTNLSPKPKKRRNNQQIIYVMPGPVEDVNIYQIQLHDTRLIH